MQNDADDKTAPPRADEQAVEDRALMERIAAGDAHAFRAFVEKHLNRTVRFAAQMTGSAADAEDIAQMAMLKLWNNAATWTPDAKVTTWLHRVTYNQCIDHLRREKRLARRHAEAGALRDTRDDRTAERDMVRDGREACVREALAGLPERQKAALVLCYYDGASRKEAADILEITEKAVESLLYRARDTLRHRLGEMLKERGYHDDA